jgi:paraquat-inducible protein A
MTLGGRRFLLAFAVVAASLCLALGVSQPFVWLTRSMSVTYEPSLLSAVSALIRSDQILLGALLLIFAIFLPVMKLLYLLLLVALPLRDIERIARQLRALEWLGRWSLFDLPVLLLAIVLIATQGAFEAAGAAGIYGFAAAVLLMMLAYAWRRADVAAARVHTPAIQAAQSSALRGAAFLLLIVLAAVLLALGVTLPATRLSGSFAGSNQHSLAGLIGALYARQAYLACFVLVAVAILLPGIKLLYLLVLTAARKLPYGLRTRSLAAVEWLGGGHAIADVMVLALMALYLGAPGQASILPGAYCFAGSVLLIMLAYGWANAPGPAAVRHTSLSARLAGLGSEEAPSQTQARRPPSAAATQRQRL